MDFAKSEYPSQNTRQMAGCSAFLSEQVVCIQSNLGDRMSWTSVNSPSLIYCLSMRIAATILVLVALIGLLPQLAAVDLPSAKVVSLYESILDTDTATLTRILSETGTQVVYRGYFRWGKEDLGVYSRLALVIGELKAKLPWIHIMGAITCAAFLDGDYWPNGTIVSPDQKRQMLWTLTNGTMPRHFADPTKSYVLDISKPLARQFVLAYAYRLIDAGFDSLWFDEVQFIPWNSGWAYGLGQISDAPYVEAWKEISSAVKQYARAKYGKELPVSLNNAWVNAIGEYRWPASRYWPYQDFISIGISLRTMETQSIQDDWAGYKIAVAKVYGHVPTTVVFMDWGKTPTPLSIFGNLPRDAQVRMLKLLHETATREGLLFAYPLHGGNISNYLIPPFAFVVYDARQQGTYDTIRELTNSLVRVYIQTETFTATTTVTRSYTKEAMTTVGLTNNFPSYLILRIAIVVIVAIGFIIVIRRRR
jgi:hypothetical protein